jgi:hypothetical protein
LALREERTEANRAESAQFVDAQHFSTGPGQAADAAVGKVMLVDALKTSRQRIARRPRGDRFDQAKQQRDAIA